MNSKITFTSLAFAIAVSPLTYSYEVWMGMHGTPTQAGQAANIPTWSKTAIDSLSKAGIQGINGAKSAVAPVAGTSTANYTAPSNAQFKSAIEAITNRDNAVIELPRDSVGAVTDPDSGLVARTSAAMDQRFADALARGYTITKFMLHGSPNANTWSIADIGILRAELDRRKVANPAMPDVELGFIIYNHTTLTQNIVLNPAIDFITFEISPDLWKDSGAARLQHLQWFWANPNLPTTGTKKLGSKKVFFQLFGKDDALAYNSPTFTASAYQSTRLMIRDIGLQMPPGFLASNRVILSPTTNGNPSVIPFFPETEVFNGIPNRQYSNTKTGVTLSLLEQKSLFEAAAGVTESRARSTIRLISP